MTESFQEFAEEENGLTPESEAALDRIRKRAFINRRDYARQKQSERAQARADKEARGEAAD